MTTQDTQITPDDRLSGFATHDVMNQPGALDDYNAYFDDKPLVDVSAGAKIPQ